jgi:hypothetical protein
LHHVQEFEVAEADLAEAGHLMQGGRGRSCGEGNGQIHYTLPAWVQVQVCAGGDAFTQEAVDVCVTLAQLGGESRVN